MSASSTKIPSRVHPVLLRPPVATSPRHASSIPWHADQHDTLAARRVRMHVQCAGDQVVTLPIRSPRTSASVRRCAVRQMILRTNLTDAVATERGIDFFKR
jgi:hypothetical protein